MTVTLYNADCLDILPTLGRVDCVLTDPPYGIGEHGGACRTRGRPGYAKHENHGWDTERPSKSAFQAILRAAPIVVIWGGNYFADLLPASMGWLYWRKLMGGDFSDGELAWTSRQMALREFTFCPKGMDKEHPAQKPLELMAWCLDTARVPIGATILDPYMGSGSVGVVCVRTGRGFIGIERDPVYFAIAQRRIAEAQLQPSLLTAPPETFATAALWPSGA